MGVKELLAILISEFWNADVLQQSASENNCFEHAQNHSLCLGSFPECFQKFAGLSAPAVHCVW